VKELTTSVYFYCWIVLSFIHSFTTVNCFYSSSANQPKSFLRKTSVYTPTSKSFVSLYISIYQRPVLQLYISLGNLYLYLSGASLSYLYLSISYAGGRIVLCLWHCSLRLCYLGVRSYYLYRPGTGRVYMTSACGGGNTESRPIKNRRRERFWTFPTKRIKHSPTLILTATKPLFPSKQRSWQPQTTKGFADDAFMFTWPINPSNSYHSPAVQTKRALLTSKTSEHKTMWRC